jgi:hypothetical protein
MDAAKRLLGGNEPMTARARRHLTLLLTSKRISLLVLTQQLRYWWPEATVTSCGGWIAVYAKGVHVEARTPREVVAALLARH